MILLVHPDKETFLIIVPDPTSVRPVSRHPSTGQQGRHGFVEQKVIIDQLFLLLVRHLGERIVLSFEFPTQANQCVHSDTLHRPPLRPGAVRRQAVSADAASRPYPTAENVVRIHFASLNLCPFQIRFMDCVRTISSMSFVDHWIEEILEDFIGFFISSHTTHSVDEWMAYDRITFYNGLTFILKAWHKLLVHDVLYINEEKSRLN